MLQSLSSLSIRSSRLQPVLASLSTTQLNAAPKSMSLTPPKRPGSAVGHFLKDQFHVITPSCPKGSGGVAVLREANKKFVKLSDADKAKYKEKCKVEWEVYKKEDEKFRNMLINNNQVAAFQKAMSAAEVEREEAKLVRKRNKLILELDRPKQPAHAFKLYFKDYCQEHAGEQNVQNRLKAASKKWASLSESAKATYVSKAESLAISFKTEMPAWRKKHEGTYEMEKLIEIRERLRIVKKQRKAMALTN